MRVVIIGPGRIGCGYLAPLFCAAGWQVTLVAHDATTADRIRTAGRYTAVELPTPVSADGGTDRVARTTTVTGFAALELGDAAFRAAIGEADLVCTAVGVGNVLPLAGPLAEAMIERSADRPLDVWLVENGDVADRLEAAIRRRLAHRLGPLPALGVAGAVATVAVGRGGWDGVGAATFVGDDERSLIVDQQRLHTPLPSLPGLRSTRSHRDALDAKLRVFNAGHAICAYLGRLRGHRTVDEAVGDHVLRPIVAGAMLESVRTVAGSPEGSEADGRAVVARALHRFANAGLADPISRVGRDPIRKLAPGDRLVAPLRAVHESTGVVPAYFALGVAAALLYRDPDDAEATTLQRRLVQEGLAACLADICDLAPGDPLTAAVSERYRGFVFDGDRVSFPPARPVTTVDLPDLQELRR